MSERMKKQPRAKILREYAERVNGIPPSIVTALDHEVRRAILGVMAERGEERVSPVELSRLLEEGLTQISYHVRVLRDTCGVIEVVATEPRRGAVEHYYRLTPAMKEWLSGR